MTQAKLLEKKGYKIDYLEKSVLEIKNKDELSQNHDVWIVLSKHSSKANQPSLTTHSVGNFSKDKPKLGGLPENLGISLAPAQSILLKLLYQYQQENFEYFSNMNVTFEATHHGPTIPIPLTFIEMGSNKKIWTSDTIAEAVVWAIDRFLIIEKIESKPIPIAIGFGGPHYPYKFSSLVLNNEYYIGHILPKYAANNIHEGIIRQMIERTIPKPTIAVIDKKGIKQKSILKNLLTNFDLEIREI
ncbi:MAG: D-aminoacyl-tRNA deacylase [Candidatus Thorarchaeota archaeon]